MKVERVSRWASALLLLSLAATVAELANAAPVAGKLTSGGAAVVIDRFVNAVNTAAKSNTCAAAISNVAIGGAISNLESPANPDACTVTEKNAHPAIPALNVNGTGNLNQDKFTTDINGRTVPAPANSSARTNDLFEVSGGPTPAIDSFWSAGAVARVAGGFIGPDNPRYTAVMSGTAQVKDQLAASKSKLPMTAASAADDPFSFLVSGGGSFAVHLELFGDGVATTENGDPIDGLHLSSNLAGGSNHFDVSAGFAGPVWVNGQAFTGDLFELALDAKGVIVSKSDVAVSFSAWAGLGLSPQAIQDYERYIWNSLELLADGSVGLPGGSTLSLMGAGTPFDPTITFAPGSVDFFASIAQSARTTPEPGAAALVLLGLFAMRLGRSRPRAAGV